MTKHEDIYGTERFDDWLDLTTHPSGTWVALPVRYLSDSTQFLFLDEASGEDPGTQRQANQLDFKGRHWSELSEFLGILREQADDVDRHGMHDGAAEAGWKQLHDSRGLLGRLSMGIQTGVLSPAQVAVRTCGVRVFVTKLAEAAEERSDDCASLWRGLSAIKGDGQFLKVTATLFHLMRS